MTTTAPFTAELELALDGGGDDLPPLTGREPESERDELTALGLLHELWMAPIERTAGRERHQSDPSVAVIKRRLEGRFLQRLEHRCRSLGADRPGSSREDAVTAVRRVATRDLVPAAYRRLEDDATLDELVAFLSLEGGPDAGFDDLVALAQVGLAGLPKVALALNYWDEMGRGDPAEVHTELHHRMARTLGLVAPDPRTAPIGVLERAALGGVLATNRSLQPELVGALGLLELQAGPRCRAVVRALDRLGVPDAARAFYAEHAEADPRHGKDWLERAVRPLADKGWGPGIVRGAVWRQEVNRRFFDEVTVTVTGAKPRRMAGATSG